MAGFTGFGGNSIGGDSQFGNMGGNDPYGSGNNSGNGSFGHKAAITRHQAVHHQMLSIPPGEI